MPKGTWYGRTALERFLLYVDIDRVSGCWVWTGTRDPKGYGRFNVPGRTSIPAHRWLWEQANGPVPGGLQLDHFACDNKSCVNPEHLRPVTSRENNLRSNNVSARNIVKTHCPQGHPYDDENTLWDNGRRRCRICRRDQQRRADAKRKAA